MSEETVKMITYKPDVRLQRIATGYRTPDGRFTIERRITSGGANMIGGYSGPGRTWVITDTSGARPFARPCVTATFATARTDRLSDARLRIAAVLRDGKCMEAT